MNESIGAVAILVNLTGDIDIDVTVTIETGDGTGEPLGKV